MSTDIQRAESSQDNMLVFGSQTNFEQAMRMAKSLSSSTIVPVAYQGEKGLPNCIIALEMANRIGMSPLMVMQNLYVVYGNISWSSKFLIAALNASGKFKTPLRYEYKGTEGTDSWGCRAYAIDRECEQLYGSWVTIEMAKKEGWYSKNGSKWQTMPELMLQYRSAAFFSRTYAPEIGMGMQTTEELNDVIDIDYRDVTTSEKVLEEIKQNANKQTISISDNKPDAVPAQQPTPKSTPTQNEPHKQQAQPVQPIGTQPKPTIFG